MISSLPTALSRYSLHFIILVPTDLTHNTTYFSHYVASRSVLRLTNATTPVQSSFAQPLRSSVGFRLPSEVLK
ncbi:unnamed protein product [Acanthoscelides obtectus]|uniref:Uncharacterized protein n=1 Tax=Acanthoscelides obtectus TaxID=200917 RepID=A0A9P0NXT0_ACAOB|nr:unnamed protein product [Acanthoscelides obtectus]CAK1642924.1 hypothetical protein AOBTE_LOCUS13299 [Acanthoscelides obtectus]